MSAPPEVPGFAGGGYDGDFGGGFDGDFDGATDGLGDFGVGDEVPTIVARSPRRAFPYETHPEFERVVDDLEWGLP